MCKKHRNYVVLKDLHPSEIPKRSIVNEKIKKVFFNLEIFEKPIIKNFNEIKNQIIDSTRLNQK
jgi:hypothetical protein